MLIDSITFIAEVFAFTIAFWMFVNVSFSLLALVIDYANKLLGRAK